MTPTLHDPPAESTLAALGIESSNPGAIVDMCDQYTHEWFAGRLGVPTASAMKNIITGTGKVTDSQTRASYLHDLLAERLVQTVKMNHSTPSMERGSNLEPRARDWYELETGRTVTQVGFVWHSAAKRHGCSPDGICTDRIVEIKCPMNRGMLATLLLGRVPAEYLSQIRHQMYVCGVDRGDFVLYTPEPELPNVIWTVEKDPDWCATFESAIEKFLADLDAAYERIIEMRGYTP
jgi:putative phage-type endonuclease